MNSLGWIGGGVAPVAIAAASKRFGMSACISASSAIYLLIAVLLIFGIRRGIRNFENVAVNLNVAQAPHPK